MLQNQIGYFDRLAAEPEFVRVAYGDNLGGEGVKYRQHEAHVVSLLFKWNWEYLRIQDGIYPLNSIPVEGFRWQYHTVGIDKQWEEKRAWFDDGFVEFAETEVIPYATPPNK
ncbi:MAG: hypothetical protein ACI96M_004516 [Candidatus Azotimanducaceae bacterium]|jgi:hypothetical protein